MSFRRPLVVRVAMQIRLQRDMSVGRTTSSPR